MVGMSKEHRRCCAGPTRRLRGKLDAKEGLLLAIALLAIPAACGQPTQIHMTWQSDPRYSITVSWRTPSECPSVVEYGTALPYGSRAEATAGQLHHVVLEGLEPGTVYHFRCGSELGWSQDLTFQTAPEDPSQGFTFVALGDSRTNWDTWGRCANATLQTDPAFVLHTGDLVESGGVQSEWDIWFLKAESLLSKKVIMPVLGNHEGNNPKYYEQFALPNVEDWYSFDYGCVHFIGLTTEKSMIGAQRAWLEQDLSSTNATWKFVYYHSPMYSSAGHGCNRDAYQAWGDLFDKYHVDMVFNGHDHTYERTYPMNDDWLADSPENGTIHIVTGGAGAPLGGLVSRGPWCASFLANYHFLLVTVNETYLRVEARFYNQSIFDEVRVSKARLPDLRPESVATVPTFPGPGENARIVVTVVNSGKSESGECGLRTMVNGNVLSAARLSSIQPGERSSVELEWRPAVVGIYNLSVSVDPYGEVPEGLGETNNEIGSSVLVSDPKPDLLVEAIDSSTLIPASGETIRFLVDLRNRGSAASGSFGVDFRLNNITLNHIILDRGLQPGEAKRLESPWPVSWGDWEIAVEVDTEHAVDELFEDNNLKTASFLFRDFCKWGPAYLPQGFAQGEMVLVYYNRSEGRIPADSSTCVAVWGMNGWKNPPARLAPPGTVTRTLFETPMQNIRGDLWFATLPTAEGFNWIDLKFEDRQVLATAFDDNNGSNWAIPCGGWVQSRFNEFMSAIADAEAAGVDVAEYRGLAEEANLSLAAGHLTEALKSIHGAVDRCRLDECRALLETATSEYQKAIGEGLEVPRAESFLTAARGQLDYGNYPSSKKWSLLVLDLVEEARAKVPESACLVVLAVWALLVWKRRPDGSRNREH